MSNQQYIKEAPRQHIPALKIIGTVLLMMILICGGLVVYGVYQYSRWASALARGPIVAAIDQAKLPDVQKTALKQNIARVCDAFQRRQMSYSQFKAILQNLRNGSFLRLVEVESIRYQYTTSHPTKDDEHRRAMLVLDRFERGIAEKLIAPGKVAEILSLLPASAKPESGEKDHSVTEAVIESVINAMRVAADAAEIPAVNFQPDFAEEVNKAITAVTGTATSKSTATQPASSTPAGREVLHPVNVVLTLGF